MSEEKSGGGISLATKSRHNTPENFFPVIVDDFFNDPEALVDFGKSLPKEDEERQPGRRSRTLWEIDSNLCRAIILKIVSCYYDLDYIDISWQESEMSFREIPRFSENKNDVINKGWIHQDPIGDTYQLAGLIYLTPDIDPDSGTSLYQINQRNDKEYKVLQKSFAKKILYKDLQLIHQMDFEAEIINAWSMKGQNSSLSDKDKFNEAYFLEKYKEQEELFTEKTRFANIYNRLIMYDTNEFHRANNYWNDDGKDPRLTLVFFIGGFNVGTFPLEKIKGGEYDEFIGHQSKIW